MGYISKEYLTTQFTNFATRISNVFAKKSEVPKKFSDLTNDGSVTYTSQTLTNDQKTQARNNIGAGTSNFSGNYNDLTNKPSLNYIPTSEKGSANGVATLDSDGKVPSTQLPSYVDDVIEGYYDNGKFYKESAHTTEITAEKDKIYVDLSTNKTYRYSGSAYVEISASLVLGETSSTAYRGDRGKTAYDHSQSAHAPSNAQKNVQSDWNITDTTSDAYIKNKPSIPSYTTEVLYGCNLLKNNNTSIAISVDSYKYNSIANNYCRYAYLYCYVSDKTLSIGNDITDFHFTDTADRVKTYSKSGNINVIDSNRPCVIMLDNQNNTFEVLVDYQKYSPNRFSQITFSDIGDTLDTGYSCTIKSSTSGNSTVQLPSSSGTLALTSQIPTVPTEDSGNIDFSNYFN